MPAAPDPLNRKVTDSEQTAKDCEEIEGELTVLKVAYEQFFLGLERQPPTEKHKLLRRKINELRQAYVRQTALKFRVGNLAQKFLTYERLWQRTLQEIENGTYRRDLYKARLHQRKRAGEAKSNEPKATGSKANEAKPAASEGKAAAASNGAGTQGASSPAAVPPGQLSDAKVRAIYDAYVTAKRRCGEDVSRITVDGLASTLRKQVPELLKQHKARSVEFKVVIKDGKAVLRAVPKE